MAGHETLNFVGAGSIPAAPAFRDVGSIPTSGANRKVIMDKILFIELPMWLAVIVMILVIIEISRITVQMMTTVFPEKDEDQDRL